MGFTFLELHLIKPNGDCACRWFSSTRQYSPGRLRELRAQGIYGHPCKNPGKHPVRTPSKSVMTSVDAIEAHLDKGGSVGLVLRLNGLPPPTPIRLVIFDCDRPGAKEWLEARGITSPFQVKGKRGWHIYALLPQDCPDLKSDTRTLNSGKSPEEKLTLPGIDIKVSGHVVIPFSPNKTLLLDGVNLSEDPAAMARIFQDAGSFAAVLPVIDPRILVPTMREFIPEEPEEAAPTFRITRRKIAKTKRIRLSMTKVPKDTIQSPLNGIPYHRRKDMAIAHLRRAKCGVGEGRRTAMLRVFYALSKHYWLTEADRFMVVKKHYNLRVRDEDGSRHPFRDCELHRMVRYSSGSNIVSPFGLFGDAPAPVIDVLGIVAKVQKRNLRSNGRRAKRRQETASYFKAEVQRFIAETCTTTLGSALKIRQADLHQAYQAWTASQHQPAGVSHKRFGQILDALDFGKTWCGHQSHQYRLGIDLMGAG